ncbi:DUF4145 domain-containing protein [Luteimonas vadosa]
MKIGDYSEEAQQRLDTLISEMSTGSARTVAVVGGAWVEEMLAAAIESALHPHKKAWEGLFNKSRPLSSFSAKIDMARLLGLVTDAIWADLHRIREIRNTFAHDIAHKTDNSVLSFASPHISDQCLAILCVAKENLQDPRHRFTRACARLTADLDMVRFFGTRVTGPGQVTADGVDAA